MITEDEKILLSTSIDLAIQNISGTIVSSPELEVKEKYRTVMNSYVSLLDKVNSFKIQIKK